MTDEERETEALLEQERSRLSTLITDTNDGVVLLDSSMRLLLINPAAQRYLTLSGEPEHWVDRSLLDVVRHLRSDAPRGVAAILEELHRIRSGDETTGEGIYHGENHIIHWRNLPVHAEQGILGRLLIFNDETATQVIQDPHATAHLSSGQIDGLLDAFIGFVEVAALSSGRMPLSPTAFSFSELTDCVLESEQSLAQQRRLSLEHHINSSLTPTWGDRALIKRVLHHLIASALRSTSPGGTVQIEADTTARDLEKLRVSITDSGHPGLRRTDSDPLQFAGDPRRIDADLERAFCHLVLEAHGERIWVSRNTTAGTTVAFTLPQLSESLVNLNASY